MRTLWPSSDGFTPVGGSHQSHTGSDGGHRGGSSRVRFPFSPAVPAVPMASLPSAAPHHSHPPPLPSQLPPQPHPSRKEPGCRPPAPALPGPPRPHRAAGGACAAPLTPPPSPGPSPLARSCRLLPPSRVPASCSAPLACSRTRHSPPKPPSPSALRARAGGDGARVCSGVTRPRKRAGAARDKVGLESVRVSELRQKRRLASLVRGAK